MVLHEHGTSGALTRLVLPCLLYVCGTQLARLMKRDGCSRAAAEARVGAQMPLSKKTALADIVISNEGSLQDLQQQVGVAGAAVQLMEGSCQSARCRPELILG
jgi:hypothetical protein